LRLARTAIGAHLNSRALVVEGPSRRLRLKREKRIWTSTKGGDLRRPCRSRQEEETCGTLFSKKTGGYRSSLRDGGRRTSEWSTGNARSKKSKRKNQRGVPPRETRMSRTMVLLVKWEQPIA